MTKSKEVVSDATTLSGVNITLFGLHCCFHGYQMFHSCDAYHCWLQEDAVGAQPRVVFMHKCMQLECWPATAIVAQLHLAHINLSYVIMDTKSRPAPLLQ